VQIELLVAMCVGLAAVAVAMPLWLLAESHPLQTGAIDGLARTCERALRRGPMAPLGYAAGALLSLWGASVLATLLGRSLRDLVLLARLQQRLNRMARNAEIFVAGQPARVRVLPDTAGAAFTLGLFRPRIYITRGLLDALDSRELQAVVLHEAAHARRRDPLRCWLVRLGASSLWCPRAPGLARRFAVISELQADEAVMRSTGDERPLLGALLKADALAGHRLACSLTGEGARLLREIRLQSQPSRSAHFPVLAGVALLGCLALLAAIGLTDWESYWACAQGRV
jgi:beta-lactamase regulating signal transducer with metallopeptidase domain